MRGDLFGVSDPLGGLRIALFFLLFYLSKGFYNWLTKMRIPNCRAIGITCKSVLYS